MSERDRFTAGSIRGQSEVIGFVIVFSAILSATIVVSVFGLTALDDVRKSTVANNGEVAMQAVSDDVHSIYYGSAESRTTELTLDSASLDVGDPTRVTVGVESTDSPSTIDDDWTWRLTPLVYRTDAASIYYETSLVVRQQRNGAVAVTDSLFRMDDDRAVIPVVRTNATANESVSGGTRRIEAFENGTESVVRTTDPLPNPSDTLEVTVTISGVSGREGVWARTLNDAYSGSASSPCAADIADDEVTCTFETDRLVVSSVAVEYTLE